MKAKFYNAVRNGACVGDGTVGALVDWVEKYVNVIFPENGIEYWSDQAFGGSNALPRGALLPVDGAGDESAHHVACYVRGGTNEGHIINVLLYLRNDTYKSVTWAKTFGSSEECWQICAALTDALEDILFFKEIPEIVDMADKVPRQHRWHRETNLTEEITISSTMSSLKVATCSGLVLDSRSWVNKGENAHFYVESRVKDWQTVLTNTKCHFKMATERRVIVDDLPGYLITDRGVEGNEGMYVLPPDGNELDDRTWLGYYKTPGAAIQAARQHRDAQARKAA